MLFKIYIRDKNDTNQPKKIQEYLYITWDENLLESYQRVGINNGDI